MRTNKNKMIAVVLIVCLALSLFSGCGTSDASGAITVTDVLGREVTLDATATSAVAIGPGALRLYVYASDITLLCGTEQIEVDNAMGRGYVYANPELTELDVIGAGGPANAPDAEKLIVADPDVIFTTYVTETTAAEELQEKTGIPVIALSYGNSAPFSEEIYASMELIGDVMGTEEKADAAVAYIKSCQSELNELTQDLTAEEKATVYYGAQSYKGAHGIESTSGGYELFAAINTESVVDTDGINGYVMVDKEQLLQWDPEIIFLDYGGLSLVVEDYENNPSYYEALQAFNNGTVYAQLPYNYYSCNLDVAMLNAYYMGSVLYPDHFASINIDEKATEIFTTLLGENIYEQITGDFGTLTTIDIMN